LPRGAFTGSGSGSGGPSSQHSCNIVIFRFAMMPLPFSRIATSAATADENHQLKAK
jgi:hypothetical protein